MCTHQVNRGLGLLLSSFAGILVSAMMFFGLVIGAVGVVAGPKIEKANAQLRELQAAQQRSLQQLDIANQQMQASMSKAARQLNAAPAPSIAFPAVSGPTPVDPKVDRQRQYDIAMQQQRAAEAKAAAERAHR